MSWTKKLRSFVCGARLALGKLATYDMLKTTQVTKTASILDHVQYKLQHFLPCNSVLVRCKLT
jgi:hypothetical protein